MTRLYLAAAVWLSVAVVVPAFGQGVTRVGAEFQVNTYTTSDQSDVSVASDLAGNFIAVWHSYGQDGSRGGIFGEQFAADGTRLRDEFQINTYTTGHQSSPAISYDPNGNFVVVWESYGFQSSGQDGDSSGIFGRRFAADGTALGSEFQVNTYTTGLQRYAAVSADADGDFVVVWHSPTESREMFRGQLFDSTGTPVGAEFEVNNYPIAIRGAPSVSSDAAGNFVVVWSSYRDINFGIFGQRFGPDATRMGDEFQASVYRPAYQAQPAVAFDHDGEFLVVWRSNNQPGAPLDSIFGRRFGSDGTSVGDEFLIGAGVSPSIDSDSDGAGDFIVAWTGRDVSGNAAVGRWVSAEGELLGNEFQANTYTTGFQGNPSVTADEQGGFVVAWSSEPYVGGSQDGSQFGVFGQRFEVETVTLTATATPTIPPTIPPTLSETVTPTGTAPPTETATPTATPSIEQTSTATPGVTSTATDTPLEVTTSTPTETGGLPTETPPAPETETATPTAAAVLEPTSTVTQTSIPTPTNAPRVPCDADADCLDENACNGNETCVDGSCAAGVPLTCASLALTTAFCTAGADSIEGTDGDDVLGGGAGNDTIAGRLGNDTICGHQGDDVLQGNPGEDVIGGGQGADTLVGGKHPDQLFGQRGDDMLLGSGAGDFLGGGRGNDTLDGGFGPDTVQGNAGTDRCVGEARLNCEL